MRIKLTALVMALAICLGLGAPAGAYRGGSEELPAVAMSVSHTAYVDAEGVLWTWGRNRYGELGNGSMEDSDRPVRIMSGVAAVSVSDGVTAAVKKDGSLWMWGSNYHGQLGNGGKGDVNIHGTSFDKDSQHFLQTTPVRVLDEVAAVYTANTFTAAVRRDGSLWMWGGNQYGCLGFAGGEREDRYGYFYQMSPRMVMENVEQVVLSDDANAVAVIRGDGSLWMWGSNEYGQLGFEGGNEVYDISYLGEHVGEVPYQTEPVKIMEDVAAVSIGANHTAAVRADGSLWTWGRNFYGQLGNGTREDSFAPVRVLEDVSSVSLGWSSSAAVKRDGSLWTWGRNFYGQLGNGTREDSAVPARVLEDAAWSVCDRDYYAAVKTDGSLWTWGWNYNGQLGTGEREDALLPVQVLEDVAAVSGDQTSMAAVCGDGSLWTWGDSYYGQLGGGREAALRPEERSVDGPRMPFADVELGDWFYDDVYWVWEREIMRGDGGEDVFNPGGATTRAMVVTVLYRLEGEPEAGSAPFPDVGAEDWYAAPVAWAAEKGVVNGKGDGFDPMGAVSRQELAAILYRYAGSCLGLDVSGRAELAVYPDASEAAEYAWEALAWASAEGLVGGSGGMLEPCGSAQRAQTAAILARFCVKNRVGIA